jgi:hypothetical protein
MFPEHASEQEGKRTGWRNSDLCGIDLEYSSVSMYILTNYVPSPYQDRETSASARHHDLFDKTIAPLRPRVKLELGPGCGIARRQSALPLERRYSGGGPIPWHVSLKKEIWELQRGKREGPAPVWRMQTSSWLHGDGLDHCVCKRIFTISRNVESRAMSERAQENKKVRARILYPLHARRRLARWMRKV